MRIRCFDLETTGFEPTDHVVEIAAWDLLVGEGVSEVHSVDERLVKPPVPIPPITSAVHHIVDDDVAAASEWKDVHPRFLRDDHLVDAYCAHNARFERQWLTLELGFKKLWVCTLKCAYRIWPDAPSHSNQALRYWLKPEQLDRSVAVTAHRAGADAYVTAHILSLMFRQPKVELNGLILCSSRPSLLPRVQFGKHAKKPWAEVPRDYLEWITRQADMDEDVKFTAAHYLKVGT